MQSIILMGYLGNDPEEKLTSNGMKVTSFSMGVGVYTNKKTHTQWYRINVWNGYLGNIMKHLRKGSFILVQGDLELPRIYRGKDGESKIDLSVNVVSIKFIPTKKEKTPQQEKEAAIKEVDRRHATPPSAEDFYAAGPSAQLPTSLPF